MRAIAGKIRGPGPRLPALLGLHSLEKLANWLSSSDDFVLLQAKKEEILGSGPILECQ